MLAKTTRALHYGTATYLQFFETNTLITDSIQIEIKILPTPYDTVQVMDQNLQNLMFGTVYTTLQCCSYFVKTLEVEDFGAGS